MAVEYEQQENTEEKISDEKRVEEWNKRPRLKAELVHCVEMERERILIDGVVGGGLARLGRLQIELVEALNIAADEVSLIGHGYAGLGSGGVQKAQKDE